MSYEHYTPNTNGALDLHVNGTLDGMGRPLSPTGSVMDEHILEAEIALSQAEKAAVIPLVKREVDLKEWAGFMGEVIQELRNARQAVVQIRNIIEDNKRRGTHKE